MTDQQRTADIIELRPRLKTTALQRMERARQAFLAAYAGWLDEDWPSHPDVADEIDGTGSALRQIAALARVKL